MYMGREREREREKSKIGAYREDEERIERDCYYRRGEGKYIRVVGERVITGIMSWSPASGQVEATLT